MLMSLYSIRYEFFVSIENIVLTSVYYQGTLSICPQMMIQPIYTKTKLVKFQLCLYSTYKTARLNQV